MVRVEYKGQDVGAGWIGLLIGLSVIVVWPDGSAMTGDRPTPDDGPSELGSP